MAFRNGHHAGDQRRDPFRSLQAREARVIADVAGCPLPSRRLTFRAAAAFVLVIAALGTSAAGAPAIHTFTTPEGERPDYVRKLEKRFGVPSYTGFGSTVLFASGTSASELEEVALAAYRHFTGKLWQEWGEAAWMGAWKLIHRRAGTRNIITELRQLADPQARSSAELMIDATAEADDGKAALSAAFDDAAVSELLVFSIGDSAAMTGLLVAARRSNGDATFLVFMMD